MYYCDECLDTYQPYDGMDDNCLCEDCRDRLIEAMAADEADEDE